MEVKLERGILPLLPSFVELLNSNSHSDSNEIRPGLSSLKVSENWAICFAFFKILSQQISLWRLTKPFWCVLAKIPENFQTCASKPFLENSDVMKLARSFVAFCFRKKMKIFKQSRRHTKPNLNQFLPVKMLHFEQKSKKYWIAKKFFEKTGKIF